MTKPEMVTVRRADGEIVQASRRSWDAYYQYRAGWQIVDDPKADAPQDLGKMTRAELDAVAVHRGLDPDEYGRKAELIAALEGSDE